MTYFAGVVLHNQVAVVADRRFIEFTPILRWGFNRFVDHDRPKWQEIPLLGATFYLTSGTRAPAEKFFNTVIRDFAAGEFTINDLRSQREHFGTVAASIWSKMEPRIYEINTKRLKLPASSVSWTVLFGGLDSTGNPFLMVFEDYNRFQGDILTSPGQFYVLPEKPECEKRVAEKISNMLYRLKETFGNGPINTLCLSEKGKKLERDIAKEALIEIVPFVSMNNKYVSPCGDLLIIHRGGREVTGFDL